MSSKVSVSFFAVLLAVVLGYLAYDPTAAQSVANWVKRQVGDAPEMKPVGAPNYMPVLPN